jgi:hypothetical protein
MRKRFLLELLVLSTAVLVSFPQAAQAQDPWNGSWKLNLAKSKYEPAGLAPKSQTLKQEALPGAGMKAVTEAVDAQGATVRTEVTSRFDGKPSEVKGAPDAKTTRVYRRIDARSYEYVQSVNGKQTTTVRTVVAADGKSRTITTTGKNAQGQTVANVAVYDRQ